MKRLRVAQAAIFPQQLRHCLGRIHPWRIASRLARQTLRQGKRAFERHRLVAPDSARRLQLPQGRPRQVLQRAKLLQQALARRHRRDSLGAGPQDDREQLRRAQRFRPELSQPLPRALSRRQILDSNVRFFTQPPRDCCLPRQNSSSGGCFSAFFSAPAPRLRRVSGGERPCRWRRRRARCVLGRPRRRSRSLCRSVSGSRR